MLPSNVPEFETVHPPTQRRGVSAGFVVTIVLVIALAAIIGIAISRISAASPPRQSAATSATQGITVQTPVAAKASAPTAAAAAAATAGGAGVPADSGTEQAIQQVIQKVDEAQIQAIKTNDPKVMEPTATPEFYQEQVINNQDLVDNGVTDIKLLKMEWGQITVNGNTATATVWETWATTFDDGSTQQSRDRNVYTLVLDNGTWKVKADEHPDQQQAASATPRPTPGP